MLNLLFALTLNLSAKTVEGVDVPEQTKLGEQTLVLNGAGVRLKRKLGMNFRVYVGALFAPARSTDATKLAGGPAVVELTFLRSLDKSTLREAWTEGVDKNCQADCEKAKASLEAFNQLMVDVNDKDRMRLEFGPEAVTVVFTGKTNQSGKIDGLAFRRAMLNVFIGPQPPTEDLKKALLGL